MRFRLHRPNIQTFVVNTQKGNLVVGAYNHVRLERWSQG